MTVAARSALVSCVFLASVAWGFTSLEGPVFVNTGRARLDLWILQGGREQKLLHEVGPDERIAITVGLHKVQALSVRTKDFRADLSEEEYSAQSKGLLLARQLWVFDGTALCVLDVKKIKLLTLNCVGVRTTGSDPQRAQPGG